jgi:GNAT superfamily N-acetyltransferase
MPQNYRLTTIEDAEKVHQLILKANAINRELGINFAAATADLALVQTHIQNNLCYVLEEDGKFIASISLRLPWGLQPGPAGFPHIGWFAVDPELGRKGVGSQLLTWLEESILRDTLKVPAVTLGTADKHPWLATYYEKKGYQQIGEKDLGRGHITLYFQKIIRKDLYDQLNKN